MKAIKYLSCILLVVTCRTFPQDQSILVFDPTGISNRFQYSLSKLTEDSVFVADTIDDSIFNYDALFLFLKYPSTLTQSNANTLIEYTSTSKPVYLYSDFPLDTNSIAFWNHIGLDELVWLLTSTLVDSITGIDTVFTRDVMIDTSFMNWAGVPVISGEMAPILHAWCTPIDFEPAFISSVDTLQVIFDLYNLIDYESFLRKVLEYFELIPHQINVDIHFFPPVDTAWIFGGCTGPDLVAHNLISTPSRDSITIEPGPNSYFFYYDSLGNQILVDKYYFIVEDSLNQYDYELKFHPKSWPPFDPVVIPFDSIFYFHQNSFDIQLLVKLNGIPIDSLSQIFRADWGLGVEDKRKIPETFSLSQNYPNPFNPSTKIKYEIPLGFAASPFNKGGKEGGFVTLKVYDVLGNEIATLVNEEKQPGTYEVEFNGKLLPSGISARGGYASGVYFYQLKAGNYIETKKMMLIK